MMKTAVLATLAATALAHGNMAIPEPRLGYSNAGNNKGTSVGPCGQGNQADKNTAQVSYKAGDTVAVTWQTDIAHGGTCRISITSEETAEPTADGSGRLSGDNAVDLTGDFACCQQNGQETRNVVIPEDFPASNGLIQWFWDGDSNYYHCADVVFEAAEVADACETAGGAAFCNNAGTCVTVGDTATCECVTYYSGDNCETYTAPTEDEASTLIDGCEIYAQGCGNGYCDTASGECVCYEGYVDPPTCGIKLENGKYSFQMSVSVDEGDMDLDVFSAAVSDFTESLATQDWDSYEVTVESSSDDDDNSASVIGGLSAALALVTVGSAYAYKKKKGASATQGPAAASRTKSSWQKPRSQEMI